MRRDPLFFKALRSTNISLFALLRKFAATSG
jgi:hypothetical protein